MKIDKENKQKRESFTMNRDTFEVQSEQEGERLDKYLSSIYPDILAPFSTDTKRKSNTGQ